MEVILEVLGRRVLKSLVSGGCVGANFGGCGWVLLEWKLKVGAGIQWMLEIFGVCVSGRAGGVECELGRGCGSKFKLICTMSMHLPIHQ